MCNFKVDCSQSVLSIWYFRNGNTSAGKCCERSDCMWGSLIYALGWELHLTWVYENKDKICCLDSWILKVFAGIRVKCKPLSVLVSWLYRWFIHVSIFPWPSVNRKHSCITWYPYDFVRSIDVSIQWEAILYVQVDLSTFSAIYLLHRIPYHACCLCFPIYIFDIVCASISCCHLESLKYKYWTTELSVTGVPVSLPSL